MSFIDMTRCFLTEATLPKKFRPQAVITVNYIQKRLPTKPNRKTPFQLWTSRKPDLSNIRTFGSRSIAYVHKSKREKLDAKAFEGILIGYDQRSKGFT
ncbi:copia protein [Nephila pilipes]|uniref:Copia protein n=1 Tax=Nephila pilipes TaxID=299642 RepID=A0A8X6NB50_NEPPI|nr:copia protein [Nephila pilipes]